MVARGADEEFLRLGVQYYIAGRSAFMAGLVPVCGNLFHHAVELLLKAKLSRTRMLGELSQRPYGHNLRLRWSALKAGFPNEVLGQLDDPIAALDRFENIRYPDSIV